MSRLKHKMLNTARKAMFIGLSLLALSFSGIALTQPAYAAIRDACNDGYMVTVANPADFAKACANHQNGNKANDQQSPNPNASDTCSQPNENCNCNSDQLNKDNCGIVYYLWLLINVLSVLTGIALVISLIVAGIQWSSAGDNPQQISAAKTRIFNVIVALLLFVFAYAFLQWVVPGGIF